MKTRIVFEQRQLQSLAVEDKGKRLFQCHIQYNQTRGPSFRNSTATLQSDCFYVASIILQIPPVRDGASNKSLKLKAISPFRSAKGTEIESCSNKAGEAIDRRISRLTSDRTRVMAFTRAGCCSNALEMETLLIWYVEQHEIVVKTHNFHPPLTIKYYLDSNYMCTMLPIFEMRLISTNFNLLFVQNLGTKKTISRRQRRSSKRCHFH